MINEIIKYFLSCSILVMLVACKMDSKRSVNSPLTSVIKLISAESSNAIDEARKYQDVLSVYGQYITGDSLQVEQSWIEYVTWLSSIKGKKLTNQFQYYSYDIIENINNDKAEVIFKSKTAGGIKAIHYKLELKKGNWVIYSIDYERDEPEMQ